jgi:peptide/nickel transport system permease protein
MDTQRFQRFIPTGKPSLSVRLMQIGGVITLFFITVSILAPVLQAIGLLQNPTDFLDNPAQTAPSPSHWFGTTRLGFDVFSRTLFAAQSALQVVFISMSLSITIGVALGMVSGYLGGNLDRVLVFIMDAIYTLPSLLLAVTLSFVLGRGVLNASVSLAIAYIPQYYRIVRNQTVSVKTEMYIEAAQSMGAGTFHILRKYLLLNVIQSVPVILTLNAADAVLTLGGLGFLGLALPPGVPEWGNDLREALDILATGAGWWTSVFPGLAMTFLVVGLSLLGEGLNELTEKKGRGN